VRDVEPRAVGEDQKAVRAGASVVVCHSRSVPIALWSLLAHPPTWPSPAKQWMGKLTDVLENTPIPTRDVRLDRTSSAHRRRVLANVNASTSWRYSICISGDTWRERLSPHTV
jgi:hypothetical protein